MPRETKENKKALQKQIGNITTGPDKEIRKIDRRKGNAVIHNKSTIDTAPKELLRIKGEKESPAAKKNKIPQKSPKNQKNARM